MDSSKRTRSHRRHRSKHVSQLPILQPQCFLEDTEPCMDFDEEGHEAQNLKETKQQPKQTIDNISSPDLNRDIMALSKDIVNQFEDIRKELDRIEAANVQEVLVSSTAASIRNNDTSNSIGTTIDQMLHSPIAPTSVPLHGPDGRPLGIEVAFNAYNRGENSTKDLWTEHLPRALSLPLADIPEQDEPEALEHDDLALKSSHGSITSEICDSTSINKSQPWYERPEAWFNSQSSLDEQEVGERDVKILSNGNTRSMVGSIHQLTPPRSPTFNSKPLPPLPSDIVQGYNTERPTQPPPRAPRVKSHLSSTVLSIIKNGVPLTPLRQTRKASNASSPPIEITAQRLPFRYLEETPRAYSASRPLIKSYSPSLNEEDPSQAHVHPAFRRPTRPKPLRFASSKALRSSAASGKLTPSPLFPPYQPRRMQSMIIERELPFSPASRHPSLTHSDPTPDRAGEYSPVTVVNNLSRASLLATGPTSPFIQRNFSIERRPSPEGQREYARAQEHIHGLERRDSEEKSAQEKLRETGANSEALSPFWMKTRTSRLKRIDSTPDHKTTSKPRDSDDSARANDAQGKISTSQSSSVYSRGTEDGVVDDRSYTKTAIEPMTDKQHKEIARQMLGGTRTGSLWLRRRNGLKQVNIPKVQSPSHDQCRS